MKLYLNNVGIIKDSEIQLDGLTVITGKNSSGKTTVGRALYSLICAGNNTVEAFEDARRRYVCSQLLEVERLLQIRRIARARFQNFNSRNGIEEALKVLATHRFMRFEDEELLGFLSYIRGAIRELTPDQYREYFLSSEKEDTRYTNSIIETVYNNISDAKVVTMIDSIKDSDVLRGMLPFLMNQLVVEAATQNGIAPALAFQGIKLFVDANLGAALESPNATNAEVIYSTDASDLIDAIEYIKTI